MKIKYFYLCKYYMQLLKHRKRIFLLLKRLSTISVVRKHHIGFLNRISSKTIYNILISKRRNNFFETILSRKVQR